MHRRIDRHADARQHARELVRGPDRQLHAVRRTAGRIEHECKACDDAGCRERQPERDTICRDVSRTICRVSPNSEGRNTAETARSSIAHISSARAVIGLANR